MTWALLIISIALLVFGIILTAMATEGDGDFPEILFPAIVFILAFICYGEFVRLRTYDKFEEKINSGEIKIEKVEVKTYYIIP